MVIGLARNEISAKSALMRAFLMGLAEKLN